ncbi:MAG: tRNA (adenosine(37)-N6)-threonylcarbamoyltransferase complex dimerization subunit type 1 TsaB [Oleibacter sp.]|nr:tRNA (adenosine(37)-N6)-threonylcarbamoyltransferase complex dimerization subunit type 1 TsaB [Thalassolituus sp.]
MPCLLALDASESYCSVAVHVNDEIFAVSEEQPRSQAQRLLPMIDELLTKAKVKRADLDGVSFGRGPGSFTGLRIAVSVAQGISAALDIPIMGISSLQALALSALTQSHQTSVMVLTNAHMGEVFWGCYQLEDDFCISKMGEQVGSPELCLQVLAEWTTRYPHTIVAGNGLLLPDFNHCDQTYAYCKTEAKHIAQLALKCWKQQQFGVIEDHPLVYLRNSIAWKKLADQPSLLAKNITN